MSGSFTVTDPSCWDPQIATESTYYLGFVELIDT
jgi:hypothetical protein